MSSCKIKFLNKPSKQAVYNFHRAYYELFKDVLEGRCTIDEFIERKKISKNVKVEFSNENDIKEV